MLFGAISGHRIVDSSKFLMMPVRWPRRQLIKQNA
jgi:hypothetical protein